MKEPAGEEAVLPLPERQRGRVLVVDDDVPLGELIRLHLNARHFQVDWCASAKQALERMGVADKRFDVVVTDLNLNQSSGIDLCLEIGKLRPGLPVIIITAYGSIEAAISSVRAGAYDFITKPLEFNALALTLDRAIQHYSMREELTHLRKAIASTQGLGELIGESAAMKEVFRLIERVAALSSSILITGESGTGKELVAHALHRLSEFREGAFVAINCGAMPETLLESELFGHVKGAFTDAHADRMGVFREANEGTLFLDEIGELPLSVQPKLLRALQERKVRPVGGNREVGFETRIVAATNVDLEEAVKMKKFREDLFYRLNVIPIELPPLRARGNDILLLAQHFVERLGKRKGQKAVLGFSPEVVERLLTYPWPGNIRELQNCIERALAISQGEVLLLEDFPERIRHKGKLEAMDVAEPATWLPMDEVERRYILKLLEHVGGNKRRAAQILGFDRTTLYRKLQQYNISPNKPE
ncbi:MAG: sigma-54 dependent transcriptional regulator [Proteobacteria bacterium]|nr:sigma-54 dependent transcriptional regulator [Cystobacterineae bacterium]MCL2314873.1 sigma-54 dependent transcriptional regulator [Pseudomonadota bacterium]